MTRRLPVSSAPPFNLGPLADGEYEAWLHTRLPDRQRPADGARPSGISAAPAPTPTVQIVAGVGVTPDVVSPTPVPSPATGSGAVEADPSRLDSGSVSGGRSSSRGTAGRHQT